MHTVSNSFGTDAYVVDLAETQEIKSKVVKHKIVIKIFISINNLIFPYT